MMLVNRSTCSAIGLRPTRLISISSLASRRLFHQMNSNNSPILMSSSSSFSSSSMDSINSKATNLYYELLGIYCDQSLSGPLKHKLVEGMFLTNNIEDMSNPVFKKLNRMVRQDPNLIEEEKLDLITSLNTHRQFFLHERGSSAGNSNSSNDNSTERYINQLDLDTALPILYQLLQNSITQDLNNLRYQFRKNQKKLFAWLGFFGFSIFGIASSS